MRPYIREKFLEFELEATRGSWSRRLAEGVDAASLPEEEQRGSWDRRALYATGEDPGGVGSWRTRLRETLIEFAPGVALEPGLFAEYAFTGAVQEALLTPWTYQFKLWGAAGGGTTPGRGGYAEGVIELTEETTVRFYVGECPTGTVGGWNGGGNGGPGYGSSPGGGASDIRIGGTELTDRVLVAAGGAGRGSRTSRGNGHGGGLVGTPSGADGSNPGTGGTQTEGGLYGGVFGVGGMGYTNVGGGGGGWYGGGRGFGTYCGGGGGSSYIGGALAVEGQTFPKVPVIDGSTTSGVQVGHGKIEVWAL